MISGQQQQQSASHPHQQHADAWPTAASSTSAMNNNIIA
jgi:hypothetical protein